MAALEMAWFGALCDDDYVQLGVSDPQLRSSYTHCSEIVLEAQRQGFDSVLLPSGYALGLDTTVMASALAVATTSIRLLTAVRVGENWPPQLARQLATLNHVARGRLDINIISSDLPGESLSSQSRYERTAQIMAFLDEISFGHHASMSGEFYNFDVAAPRIATAARPPFYFGGLSHEARDVAARHADVYLMWPDTEDSVKSIIADMTERAAEYGRTLQFGYRVHVIVRDSETEARAAAEYLVAQLDDDVGRAIRQRSLDSNSVGVLRQSELRGLADTDGYVEENLWTGIGRARSGCGAAIVGSTDQVLNKIRRYNSMGIESFILSGYPHLDECRRFGQLVLPHLDHCPLHHLVAD
jgi:alkanesulfonate monooxygenase